MVKQRVVIGLLDRAMKDFRIFNVFNDRSASALLPLIKDNVYTNPDSPTVIYTDGWAAYRGLSDLSY